MSSILCITHHDESIYDINKKIEDKVIKPERYRSVFSEQIKSEKVLDIRRDKDKPRTLIVEAKSKYSAHKTMGYAEIEYPNPLKFLKKNHGIKYQRTPTHKCVRKNQSPLPEPNREEISVKAKKNFIKMNINTVDSALPRRAAPRMVVTVDGKTVSLCKAGINPSYIYSPKFGKVPKYLTKIKKLLQDCEMNYDAGEDFQLPQGIECISSAYRNEVISGLKKNWAEIHEKFQTGPVHADTLPKKMRMAAFERILRQLEQDIMFLEENPIIYVCHDDPKEKFGNDNNCYHG